MSFVLAEAVRQQQHMAGEAGACVSGDNNRNTGEREQARHECERYAAPVSARARTRGRLRKVPELRLAGQVRRPDYGQGLQR